MDPREPKCIQHLQGPDDSQAMGLLSGVLEEKCETCYVRWKTYVLLFTVEGAMPPVVTIRQAFDLTTMLYPRSGVLRTQKLKTSLLRTQSSKVPPCKPGAGPYIALHVMFTARDFFRATFCPSGPSIHLHFSKNLSRVFSCVGCG